MMSLIADPSNKKGRVYGQECKGDAMCLGGSRPKTPPPKVEEKEEEMEREAVNRRPKQPKRQGLWARM